MTEWTNIRISKDLHKKLSARGKKSETFDETITRLIECDKAGEVRQ